MKFLIFCFILLVSCQNSSSNWHMGSDVNKNGVRDDIDTWIDSNEKYSLDVKMAISKLASIDPASCEYSHYIKCLEEKTDDAIIIQLQLLEKLNDTVERRTAYRKRIKKCHIPENGHEHKKCL